MNKPDCAKCRHDNEAEFAESAFGKCETCSPMIKYEAWLESKRKFVVGDKILNFDHLLGQNWVMYNGRAKHISFVLNNQFGVVLNWINGGLLRYAIRKGDVPKE